MKKIMYQSLLLSLCAMSLYAEQKHAIVLGASSGMGREVSKLLSKEGYMVGLVARRLPLLQSLQTELQGPTMIKEIDVSMPNARAKLSELIKEMGGLDLIVISISCYLDNRNAASCIENDYNSVPTWTEKERTLTVDAKGFIAMADVALEFFEKQNHGHLVGISSTSGLRGSSSTPVYSAAKACISCYMEAQRNYMIQNNKNVQVTDVVPGYVAVEHSPLGQDPNTYWEITTQQAGQEIMDAIKAKKKVAYIPSKVRFIAYVLKLMPDFIYNKYLAWLP